MQSNKNGANKDVITLRRRVSKNCDPNNGKIKDEAVK